MSHPVIKVLLVDDSAVIRGLMTQAINLDDQISVVGSAMHGQAALTWLNSHQADVVVLDVEMPVMDGISCLKQLRQSHPDLPVIMASSLTRAGAEITLQALDLGPPDVLPNRSLQTRLRQSPRCSRSVAFNQGTGSWQADRLSESDPTAGAYDHVSCKNSHGTGHRIQHGRAQCFKNSIVRPAREVFAADSDCPAYATLVYTNTGGTYPADTVDRLQKR